MKYVRQSAPHTHTHRAAGSSCGLHPTHPQTVQGDQVRPRPCVLGMLFLRNIYYMHTPPQVCKHEHACFKHAKVLCVLSEHVVKRRHMELSSDQSLCTEHRTSPGQILTQPTNKEHSHEQPQKAPLDEKKEGQGACNPDRGPAATGWVRFGPGGCSASKD